MQRKPKDFETAESEKSSEANITPTRRDDPPVSTPGAADKPRTERIICPSCGQDMDKPPRNSKYGDCSQCGQGLRQPSTTELSCPACEYTFTHECPPPRALASSPPHSGQAVDRQQEWTPKFAGGDVWRIGRSSCSYGYSKQQATEICVAHNAALAAERQRADQMEEDTEVQTEAVNILERQLLREKWLIEVKEIIERYNDGDERSAVAALSDIEAILWKP